ncbi:E3 ubiquitin-protein ligase RBBP6 [Crotalus adamanteus]|uniref:E3 ubiquitin-protein ligase RBBP6 n=1 Tax=Crotalus adamanteus TaxID=8729 RepID=A0AAW1B0V3_CROAD
MEIGSAGLEIAACNKPGSKPGEKKDPGAKAELPERSRSLRAVTAAAVARGPLRLQSAEEDGGGRRSETRHCCRRHRGDSEAENEGGRSRRFCGHVGGLTSPAPHLTGAAVGEAASEGAEERRPARPSTRQPAMSCVHYKFSSKLNYDTVTFDGLHISLCDLKRQINNCNNCCLPF